MALASFVVQKFDTAQSGYNVAAGVITILYTIFVLAFPLVLSPVVVFVCEAFFVLFWLVAFALATNDAGSVNCDIFVVEDNWRSACQCAKAYIAFSLFNWLLFCTSFVLFVVFQVKPLLKNKGDNLLWTERKSILRGGIYPRYSTLSTIDPEHISVHDVEPKTYEQEPNEEAAENIPLRS